MDWNSTGKRRVSRVCLHKQELFSLHIEGLSPVDDRLKKVCIPSSRLLLAVTESGILFKTLRELLNNENQFFTDRIASAIVRTLDLPRISGFIWPEWKSAKQCCAA